jgi:hypothetical protein
MRLSAVLILCAASTTAIRIPSLMPDSFFLSSSNLPCKKLHRCRHIQYGPWYREPPSTYLPHAPQGHLCSQCSESPTRADAGGHEQSLHKRPLVLYLTFPHTHLICAQILLRRGSHDLHRRGIQTH